MGQNSKFLTIKQDFMKNRKNKSFGSKEKFINFQRKMRDSDCFESQDFARDYQAAQFVSGNFKNKDLLSKSYNSKIKSRLKRNISPGFTLVHKK